jgi:hypothetical protein
VIHRRVRSAAEWSHRGGANTAAIFRWASNQKHRVHRREHRVGEPHFRSQSSLGCDECKVIASGSRKTPVRASFGRFFTGYRKTTLPRDTIIVKIIVPLNDTHDREVVRAYKQVCQLSAVLDFVFNQIWSAKWRDEDIAIVTACFSMRITSEGKISHVCLAYGGMA